MILILNSTPKFIHFSLVIQFKIIFTYFEIYQANFHIYFQLF